MSATSDLVERLRRHYVKEPQPGGLFLAECGKLQTWNGLAAVARQAAELAAVLETADRQLREVVGELQ